MSREIKCPLAKDSSWIKDKIVVIKNFSFLEIHPERVVL